ncbi:hypothetical protein ABMA70_08140 [Halobacteriovorax sp. XZX-3]|uniref:hypothetical protein n=1 Tax=unclassified Halobacteriovorax TaxID=2639665 RepID=UPI000CD08878|nr:hypothetical protein [Halobacteriovorax sp. DA5]POB12726.1 hypothetical protein C0Z22_12645 [Halobacteriovorax sp. DA5]
MNLSYFTGDYFRDYMDLLKEHKVKFKRIVVESEDPVSKNSKFIKNEIDKINGPILVVSHSKGGLEFLDVLINNPQVSKRVIGWVSMQSPYHGSVLADYFIQSSFKKTVMGWLFALLGGDVSGMESVGTKIRSDYMQANAAKIEAALENINLLQFITFINEQEGRETSLEISRNFIFERVGRNDGMVDLRSSLLKPYRHVIINDVDHLTTVLDQKNMDFLKGENESWRFDRKQHFRAILQLILESKF